MKKLVLFFGLIPTFILNAQEHQCAKSKQTSMASMINAQKLSATAAAQIVHEAKYDVKFVHLNLNLERINKNVSGGVKTVATVTASSLDTFQTLLHQNHFIDSIRFNGVLLGFLRQDSMIKVKVPTPLSNGSTFTVNLFYHGMAPTGGSAIGSGFSNGTSGSWGNQVTWSLSESFVGYHWWPCKQILTDKIDSSWVFVTTDSLNKVGSNGILKNVVTVGNKKRFEWKSTKPIAYYLISVAIAKYKEYNLYAKPMYFNNDSILIQNYIYDGAINNPSWISQQRPSLNQMPQVLVFLSKMYGMYPFYKEKYGHCMAPFGGGMEHQTMTSLGFFEYYLNAHELGHQWWGDNVTCKTWADIWINEGFACYSEHLVAQYLDLPNFATNLNSAHNAVMQQPGGSVHIPNNDTLNTSRIFSSRLTYDKGGAIVHTLRFLTNNDSLWFNTLRGFQNTFKDRTASAIDFQNYYQNFTGINPNQFFNQWYYGEGYPTFNVKFNYTNQQCFIKTTQTVSMPNITPLFITPIEYRLSRANGKPDTTIRVMHNLAIETYTIGLKDSVTGIVCDPNNWLINRTIGPARDATLGVTAAPINTLAIEEENTDLQYRIGPNPTKESIEIFNDGKLTGAKVFLYNIEGKLLIQSILEKKTIINLSNLKPNIYIVKILDIKGQEKHTRQIVKE
jgi:aminopeptidase N